MDYIGLCLISMVLMGFNLFACKLLSPYLDSNLLVLLKFGIGSILLLIYFAYLHVEVMINKYWLYAGIVGLWWAISMILYYAAIARGPASVVIPLFSLNLIIPALLGFIVLHEPATPSKILGVILAVVATVLLAS